MIRVILAIINLEHMYEFSNHVSVWSVDVNSAANINTASKALALRLFSISIKWQLHTTIIVGKA